MYPQTNPPGSHTSDDREGDGGLGDTESRREASSVVERTSRGKEKGSGLNDGGQGRGNGKGRGRGRVMEALEASRDTPAEARVT